jgi:hypothetical protein
MLVLTRRVGEILRIGSDIKVKVPGINGNQGSASARTHRRRFRSGAKNFARTGARACTRNSSVIRNGLKIRRNLLKPLRNWKTACVSSRAR